MDKKPSIFVNIKKDFYAYPTQVRWGEMSEEGEMEEHYGIAFQDKIICGGCGHPADLSDEWVCVFEELPWVDIEEFIYGE